MESCWGALKNELVHHRRFATRGDAKREITKYIEIFYNRIRKQALVSEVFVPSNLAADGRSAPLKRKADAFIHNYEQLARSMGFSALTNVSAGPLLFPMRLHAN